jgi:Tfp pilus assembly protein FimT
VELLTLLVVLIILAAIAVPGMSPVVQRYRLRGAAWQLGGDLRLARQRAVTVQKRFRICLTGCTIPVPGGSYSLERDDGPPASPQWINETGAPTRLPPEVSISATAAPTFNPTGTGSGSTFTLTNLIGTYEVVVHPTGRVRVCEGTCSP